MQKTLYGNPTRCPRCNRLGSPKNGGYCRPCYEKIQIENKGVPLVRSSFKSSYGEGFVDKEWNPKSFGIVKNSFGVFEK